MRRVASVVLMLVTATAIAGAQPDAVLSGLWRRGIDAYVTRRDYRAALAIFDSIVARDSAAMARDDSSGLRSLGNPWSVRSLARRHLGDVAGSEADLDMALRVQPINADFMIASMRMMDMDWRGAIESLDRAIEAEPGNAGALAMRA